MCLDDVLVYGGNGYGFYRRLGNMSFARKLSIGIYERLLNIKKNLNIYHE